MEEKDAAISTSMLAESASCLHPNSSCVVRQVDVNQILNNNREQTYNSEFFYEDFTSSGGTMQHWASNSYLQIPPLAIPEGQIWRIRGKIHTCLDDFVSVFDHCEPKTDNRFVSAVLEYDVVLVNDQTPMENVQFLQPVIIAVQQSTLMRSCDVHKYCVMCIEGDIHSASSVTEVIYLENNKTNVAPGQSWYELHDKYTFIHTYHFSKYVCICNVPEPKVENGIISIEAMLFGKIYEERTKKYNMAALLEIALIVQLENSVGPSPEFVEVGIN